MKTNFVVRKTKTFHSDGEQIRNAGNARWKWVVLKKNKSEPELEQQHFWRAHTTIPFRRFRILGPVPTPNFSWVKPNSNLAQPKLQLITLSLRKFGQNWGELTTPLFSFKKMTKKHLKICQKYKALVLKVFNQIFPYFQWMLSYLKTNYCKCFVLLRQVPMTQVISAKTPPSHPIVKTVEISKV